MKTKKTLLVLPLMLALLGIAVTAADAHPIRRYSPSHKPAWRSVTHSHADKAQPAISQQSGEKTPAHSESDASERTGLRWGFPGQK